MHFTFRAISDELSLWYEELHASIKKIRSIGSYWVLGFGFWGLY